MKHVIAVLCIPALAIAVMPHARAAEGLAELRQQLAEQRTQIQKQQILLEQQAAALEALSLRLDQATAGQAAPAAPPPIQSGSGSSGLPDEPPVRDEVGDLNSGTLKSGDFPGSFKIPGTKDVSLGIGGLVKTVAIFDSDAEAMGSDFVAATLGSRRPESQGAFSLDSTLTRMFIDGRAPAGEGKLRGYVEWDLNAGNNGSLDYKLRHAYGAWGTRHGTLLAGQTWSTMMDPKILPEGLTEPTVSGAIFVRQAEIRWSQILSPTMTLHVALEDAASSDIVDASGTPATGYNPLPDAVIGLEFDNRKTGHLRLNGILRRIEAETALAGRDEATAWGLALSGSVRLPSRDRLVLSGAYGEGLGRYLLGIQSTAGGVIDPLNDGLRLRQNFGGIGAYLHHWTPTLRSSAMVGYAEAKALAWQQPGTFESTAYGAVNLMWQALPYLTVGAEYAYGKLKNNDGTTLDNNRLAIGFQFY